MLPGDFNDDGVVNSQDLVGVRNEWLGIGGATYTIFGDLNGDGVVNVTDYNDVRAELGTSLPTVVPPSPTLINFDNLPAMVPGSGIIPVADRLSNQLANEGVTFSTAMGADYVPVVGPSDAVSPPNQIWLATTGNTLVLSLPYYAVINFVDPSNPSVDAVTNFVSIRGDVNGSSNTLTMEAFNVDGDLIGTDTQPDTGGETVSVSTPGIQSVHIIMSTPQGQVGGIGLDNLMFDPPVPVSSPAAVTTQSAASVTAAPASTILPVVNSSISTGTVVPVPTVSALTVGIGTTTPPAQTVTVSVSVHESKAQAALVAKARAIKRAEIRLANRGRRLSMESQQLPGHEALAGRKGTVKA